MIIMPFFIFRFLGYEEAVVIILEEAKKMYKRKIIKEDGDKRYLSFMLLPFIFTFHHLCSYHLEVINPTTSSYCIQASNSTFLFIVQAKLIMQLSQ